MDSDDDLDPSFFKSCIQFVPDTGFMLPADFGVELAKRVANNPDYTYPAQVVNSWGFDENIQAQLANGNALFGFACKVGDQLSETEKEMCRLLINRSSFPDEVSANMVPHVDVDKAEDIAQYTFFMNRALYLLPNLSVDDIDLDTFTTPEYHRQCQPGSNTKVWDDCRSRGDRHTFRITKSIIPWVFKMTIQFHCSLLPPDDLKDMSYFFGGLPVHKAILMERTKRDKTVKDMTRKCKSILLFHELPNVGLLVANCTVLANTAIPRVLAAIMDKLGGMGAEEVAETATKTRRFLLSKRRTPAHSPEASPSSETSPSFSRSVRRIRPPGCTDPAKYAWKEKKEQP